jgi:hypothetical protein
MANLAVVADLDAAMRSTKPLALVLATARGSADVFLGPVMITLFTRAVYETTWICLRGSSALFTDDLNAELGHTAVGPGGGRSGWRIAFVRTGRYATPVHGAARFSPGPRAVMREPA